MSDLTDRRRVMRSRIFLGAILCAGILLLILVGRRGPSSTYVFTLAPAFQLLGTPVSYAGRGLTRMLPISTADEAEYGKAVLARYRPEGIKLSKKLAKDEAYVNKVLSRVTQKMSARKKKKFELQAVVIRSYGVNAFALPGGIILVTQGLLDGLESEAELAAVLAHEVGHIHLSHCLDAVRFELLTRKIADISIGKLADAIVNILIRHSYSKTQEGQADEFAFATLKTSTYDPFGMPKALQALKRSTRGGRKKPADKANSKKAGKAKPPERLSSETWLEEYFRSHPYLALRIKKYQAEARRWEKAHPGAKRYVGKKNLKLRKSISAELIPWEWRQY